MQRREFLTLFLGALAVTMLPINALATAWNKSWSKAAFEATKLDEATKGLNISTETPSQDIDIIAPDRAENGAVVQIEITSNIKNTESITVLVEHNPTPLIGIFNFSNGALPFVITRIKMAEDSDLKVIVKADGKFFSNTKKVVVLENGCG
ncbi:MAG: thiosulfate oxidation carrier protein SoxY [Bdellovibrio sp.]|nr:thiosulfate oxidation carrier protein SoxY [Methylotenera sp.]